MENFEIEIGAMIKVATERHDFKGVYKGMADFFHQRDNQPPGYTPMIIMDVHISGETTRCYVPMGKIDYIEMKRG